MILFKKDNNMKKFNKEDKMQLDTLFSLLPIFTVQKIHKLIEIKDKNVNGYLFSYTGYNLDMNYDFKLFCFFVKEKITHFRGDISELMERFGYTKRNINLDTKTSFFGSIQRLADARFRYENDMRKGNMGIVYGCDWEFLTDIIEVNLDTRLIKILNNDKHKMFLNYKDLDRKFGKKLIEKKLFLYFNTFKMHTEMTFDWQNIFDNLGIEDPKPFHKISVKKAMENLIKEGDIVFYKEEESRKRIKIKLRHGKVKVVEKVVDFEEDIPF
jgi:hypothetical protein